PTPPKAATSSRPSGAAAMCCASRTISTSASPPNTGFYREPYARSSQTGPRRKWRGFCFGAALRPRRRGKGSDGVRALRHAQSGAGVPAGARIVALATDAVIALVDDAKRCRIGIERGIDKAEWRTTRGVGDCDQGRPDRGRGACPVFHEFLAVEDDAIAGCRCRRSGNIGDTAPELAIVERFRQRQSLLVGRDRKDVADPAARAVETLIPDAFRCDRAIAAEDRARAAAAKSIGARCGKPDVNLAVGQSACCQF